MKKVICIYLLLFCFLASKAQSYSISPFVSSAKEITKIIQRANDGCERILFEIIKQDERDDILLITVESNLKEETTNDEGTTSIKFKGKNVKMYWIDANNRQYKWVLNHYDYDDVTKNSTSVVTNWLDTSKNNSIDSIVSILRK